MRNLLFYCSVLFLFVACDEPQKGAKKATDTPTSGEINVVVEKGYQPVLSTSIDVFDSLYENATIHAQYVSEAEAVKALVERKALVAVISRKLREKELIPFKNRNFEPEQTCIAYDALALIVHPSNIDTAFTMQEVSDIMKGNITKWSALNPKNKAGDIQIVFDNQGSGTVRYTIDTINGGQALPANASALVTNEEVIDYVTKNKSAIGIISNNWISDTDDKGSQNFLKSISLVGIAREAGAEAFTPYQAYLYTNQYPYKRAVYAINAQPRAFGLGRGFCSFLAGPTGQRIVHKEGLLAATMQPRLIKVEQE